MIHPLKIVFFGTPNPAAQILKSLIDAKHEIIAVITKSDKRRSRGAKLIPTPVKELALSSKIEVFEPESKEELTKVISTLNADIGVVVAYGQILPKDVLDHFEYGCINVHYSVLPKFRGAAPVERAILDGEENTGVSIMKMDEGLDTGQIYLSRTVDITAKTNAITLFDSLNLIAIDLLEIVLQDIENQTPSEQEGTPSYASKLDSNDFYFDAKSTTTEVDRKVRAGAFSKGAWTTIENKRIRISEISGLSNERVSKEEVGSISQEGFLSLSDGKIFIEKIQAPGKALMSFKDWANGIGKNKFPIRIDSN